MIKQINIDDIPGIIKRNNAMLDVEEFIRSNMDSCEVISNEKTNVDSLWSAYYNAVQKLNCRVKVVRRKGRVFLVKQD